MASSRALWGSWRARPDASARSSLRRNILGKQISQAQPGGCCMRVWYHGEEALPWNHRLLRNFGS